MMFYSNVLNNFIVIGNPYVIHRKEEASKEYLSDFYIKIRV